MSLGQALAAAVGAVVLAFLLPRAVRRPDVFRPRRRRTRIRPIRRRGTSPDLASLDRLLSLSMANAEDVHVRLRPLVTDIARQRLADRTGVRLDTDAEAASALLGDATWELVRPDRPPPADRRGRGLAPEQVRAIVESLEGIGAHG